jgi:WG containing repeat
VCMGCREIARGEHTELVGGQHGYIDRTGRVVIPIAYDRADGFVDGRADVAKGGRSFAIDRHGRELAR